MHPADVHGNRQRSRSAADKLAAMMVETTRMGTGRSFRTRSGEPVHFGNDPDRMPGPENTYQSYGTAWANLSNTPSEVG